MKDLLIKHLTGALYLYEYKNWRGRRYLHIEVSDSVSCSRMLLTPRKAEKLLKTVAEFVEKNPT